MPKKSHPIADQFSDDEMAQIKRFGEALGGKPTPFDEEVDRWVQISERHYAKIRAAHIGGLSGAGSGRDGTGADKAGPEI